ncbi:hypothetical protein PLUTE_a1806 [Pseudoalteromonas luteoviolacea DSM 6061]|nr:hypothetical protein [Pseudoalteromonas luteoviolacea DSM 6061]
MNFSGEMKKPKCEEADQKTNHDIDLCLKLYRQQRAQWLEAQTIK